MDPDIFYIHVYVYSQIAFPLTMHHVNRILPSESESHSVVSNSLQPLGLYSPWNSPGQNAGVGSLSLLQGIFPTQGLSPGFKSPQLDSWENLTSISKQNFQGEGSAHNTQSYFSYLYLH